MLIFCHGTHGWSAWCYVRVNETSKMLNDENHHTICSEYLQLKVIHHNHSAKGLQSLHCMKIVFNFTIDVHCIIF